jgi:hypothetical protein
MVDGNLKIEVEEHSEQDTLMQALNTMLTRLNDVVASVTSAADTVALMLQQAIAFFQTDETNKKTVNDGELRGEPFEQLPQPNQRQWHHASTR